MVPPIHRFPFDPLYLEQIETTQGRLRDAKIKGNDLLDPLAEVLSLLREKENALSYVLPREEMVRISTLKYDQFDFVRKRKEDYKIEEQVQWAPAALFLTTLRCVDYIGALIDGAPARAEFWLGEVRPNTFIKKASGIAQFRAKLEGRHRLPLKRRNPNKLGMFGAPFFEWRYADFEFGVYPAPILAPDGLFLLPQELRSLEWDRFDGGILGPIYVILKEGRHEATDLHEVELFAGKERLMKVETCLDPDFGLASSRFYMVKMPRYHDRISIDYKINGWSLPKKVIPVVNRRAASDAALEQAFAEMNLE